MWETIKKDPLIKTIFVVLIGILAFGFAFNIMFGSGGSTMEEGAMMGSGNSLGNTLEYIIALLIKLVIIGVLIGTIIWIFRSITKQIGTTQTDRFAWLREDPIIRNTLLITGAVAVILFGLWFLRGFMAPRSVGEMILGGMAYSTSFMQFNITSIFSFILKVLIFILVLTLAYGAVMYMKENHKNIGFEKEPELSKTFIKECPDCNSKIKDNWKCCPYCGSDKAFVEVKSEEH